VKVPEHWGLTTRCASHAVLGELKAPRLTSSARPASASAVRLEWRVHTSRIAFHYPKPEHDAEMVIRLDRAAEFMKRAPGCVDVEVWRERDSGALVTTARYESTDACMAALQATAKGTDIEYDEREARRREIYNLVDPSALGRGSR